jgi:hypothetical protein
MLNMDLGDWVVAACALFALVGLIGFIYESWRPPLAPIKNTEISDKLE